MASRFEVPFDSAVLVGDTDGFGLPVVFLHAGVADRRMWAEQMRSVADAGFHVVSYDRRGFGETESPDEPFSHLADLEAVLDQLSINAAILVGNSMGGALAIDFALEHPDRTIALVLIGTAVSGAPQPEFSDKMLELFGARGYAEERRQWGTVANIDAQVWLDGLESERGRVSGPLRELFIEMDRQALGKPKLTQEEEPQPAYDNVAAITAPTLLVAGELDLPAILDRHDELSEELENGFAVTLEDTAHLPSFERPDLFDPLLLEFLEAVAGEGEEE
ncbi:MAG TPA: alpha/beta hydrolase [Devosia sp.]|nr:alpha/beta hydrolase [Devosia sp.]